MKAARRIALIALLVTPLVGAASTRAATPPVQNVRCFIGDDGAGFTSVS